MNNLLLDTNLLVRLSNTLDPLYRTALRAVVLLRMQGTVLNTTPQLFIEFWAVATRPVSANGLGFTAAATLAEIQQFQSAFPMLADTPSLYAVWEQAVSALGVQGKQVDDARLAAVAHLYKIDGLLTFNTQHFNRYANYWPGMTVLDPATV